MDGSASTTYSVSSKCIKLFTCLLGLIQADCKRKSDHQLYQSFKGVAQCVVFQVCVGGQCAAATTPNVSSVIVQMAKFETFWGFMKPVGCGSHLALG